MHVAIEEENMLPICAVGLAQHLHISGLDNILDFPAVTLLLLAFKEILAWLGFPLWWPARPVQL